MNKIITFGLGGLLFMSCANSAPQIELEGRIAMKGSEPSSYLVIEDTNSSKEYKIVNPSDFDLAKRQNHIVKLKAEITKAGIGAGFPAQINVTEVSN